jgi:hypothetical protein
MFSSRPADFAHCGEMTSCPEQYRRFSPRWPRDGDLLHVFKRMLLDLKKYLPQFRRT